MVQVCAMYHSMPHKKHLTPEKDALIYSYGDAFYAMHEMKIFYFLRFLNFLIFYILFLTQNGTILKNHKNQITQHAFV